MESLSVIYILILLFMVEEIKREIFSRKALMLGVNYYNW